MPADIEVVKTGEKNMENHIKFTREACGFCLFDLVNKELQTLKKKGEATE